MLNNAKVTVVCMCYNQSNFVEKALESVYNQTYKNIQLIITDDASKDSSSEKIKKWLSNKKEVLFIENKTNIGINKTFNKALSHSEGKYIFNLAADDILYSNCIEILVTNFEKLDYNSTGIVFGNCDLFQDKDNIKRMYYTDINLLNQFNKNSKIDRYLSILSETIAINSVSALINTSLLKKQQGFDETLLFEDLDLWLSWSRDYDILYINETIVAKRIVTTSLYSQFFKTNNKFSRELQKSVFTILKKCFQKNQTYLEYQVLLQRVFKEFKTNVKKLNITLAIRYFSFYFQILKKMRQ